MTVPRALALTTVPLVALACGTTHLQPATQTSTTSSAACPSGVMSDASRLAPVGQVLRAAQRLLSKRTVSAQGRVYRLTPRNAPIRLIWQIGIGVPTIDRREPGLLVLNRRATALCGKRIAGASWAIHYEIPVAPMISAADVYTFFVKTHRGWRFWGD